MQTCDRAKCAILSCVEKAPADAGMSEKDLRLYCIFENRVTKNYGRSN